MTPEQVFKFSRAYKLYYQGKYDFAKYHGPMKTPPLINQPDRRHYYKLAQKFNDAQIHALFTYAHFYAPKAYIGDLVTPESMSLGLRYSARAENGRVQLESDLYELGKRLANLDLQEWLYGRSIPGCLQDVIGKTLSPDVACIVLLVPQAHLQLAWLKHWESQPSTLGLGPEEWVAQLRRHDQLLYRQRQGWRSLTWDLSKRFWDSFGESLAPVEQEATPATLFD